MTVTWGAADGNGDPVRNYTVTSSTGLSQTVDGTTANFSRVPADGSNITFQVVANNTVGASDPSPRSEPRRAVTAPDAPSAVATVDGDTRVQVSWQPGSRNGLRAEEVTFQIQGGGAGTQSFGPGGWYTGMNNRGGPYTLEVRAVATIDGQLYASAWTRQSGQARPFGPPPAPNASVSGQINQVTFHYSPNGTNGRQLDRLEYVLDDNPNNWRTVRPAAAGEFSIPREPGDQACIRVRVFDTEGTESQHTVGCGFAKAPPPPSLSLSGGGIVTAPNGQRGQNFVLRYENLPVRQYRYECHHSVNGRFQQGTWTPAGQNGTTPRDTYTFCMTSYAGQSWLVLSADGQSWSTGREQWPQ